ncbi:hypothetical protein D3C79_725400 [compost metagenome]
MFADRGGVAAGHRRLAGLRHRPVFDPGAIPDLCHRRIPRGAEDERHPPGHRPWHPPSGGSALYLPPPVRGRGDCVAGRCGGLCRADADRHPGDPGPGHHRQHWRGGADLHLAAADAGGAVLCWCWPQGCRAGPAYRRPRSPAPRLRPAVGPARPLHRTQMGQRRTAGGPGPGRPRHLGQPATENRRPRQRCPRAARRLPLQPRQRLHHPALRAVQRYLRGHGQDRSGRLPAIPDTGPCRPPGLGAAAIAGCADHRVAGQRSAPDHRRHLRRQPAP